MRSFVAQNEGRSYGCLWWWKVKGFKCKAARAPNKNIWDLDTEKKNESHALLFLATATWDDMYSGCSLGIILASCSSPMLHLEMPFCKFSFFLFSSHSKKLSQGQVFLWHFGKNGVPKHSMSQISVEHSNWSYCSSLICNCNYKRSAWGNSFVRKECCRLVELLIVFQPVCRSSGFTGGKWRGKWQGNKLPWVGKWCLVCFRVGQFLVYYNLGGGGAKARSPD